MFPVSMCTLHTDGLTFIPAKRCAECILSTSPEGLLFEERDLRIISLKILLCLQDLCRIVAPTTAAASQKSVYLPRHPVTAVVITTAKMNAIFNNQIIKDVKNNKTSSPFSQSFSGIMFTLHAFQP